MPSFKDLKSAFEAFADKAWPYKYSGQLVVDEIHGGVPTNEKVAEGWIKSKLNPDNDQILQEMVAQIRAERGVSWEEAAKIANEMKNLNGFKRDPKRDGELYIEGRQLKAAIKEAASVAVASEKISGKGWGKTNKGLLGFIAEHVHVVETKLYLGVTEPTGVNQSFVSTWQGTSIKYEEYVVNATIDFTVEADYEFKDEEWAHIWLTGELQGLGASRSQGYGRYKVVKWERL